VDSSGDGFSLGDGFDIAAAMDEFSSSHPGSEPLHSRVRSHSPPYLDETSFNDLPDFNIAGTRNEVSSDLRSAPSGFNIWNRELSNFPLNSIPSLAHLPSTSSSSLQLSPPNTSDPNLETTLHVESSSASILLSQPCFSLSSSDLTSLHTLDPALPELSSTLYLQGESFIFDPMMQLETEASRSIWDNGDISSSFDENQLPMDSTWGDIISSSIASHLPQSSPQFELQDASLTLNNTAVIPQKRPPPSDSASLGRELGGSSDETTASAAVPPSEEQTTAGPRRSARQPVATAQYAALDWSYERKKRTPKKRRVGY
jgi:hypothetical protein